MPARHSAPWSHAMVLSLSSCTNGGLQCLLCARRGACHGFELAIVRCRVPVRRLETGEWAQMDGREGADQVRRDSDPKSPPVCKSGSRMFLSLCSMFRLMYWAGRGRRASRRSYPSASTRATEGRLEEPLRSLLPATRASRQTAIQGCSSSVLVMAASAARPFVCAAAGPNLKAAVL